MHLYYDHTLYSLEYAPILWSYSVWFSYIYISLTWRRPTVAETCRRQHNKYDTRQLCFDVHYPLPKSVFLYCAAAVYEIL